MSFLGSVNQDSTYQGNFFLPQLSLAGNAQMVHTLYTVPEGSPYFGDISTTVPNTGYFPSFPQQGPANSPFGPLLEPPREPPRADRPRTADKAAEQTKKEPEPSTDVTDAVLEAMD